eukprot:TRINITY_DN19427_c0_g1_i1.p1 TRINITY_DN19427_c0_g1~~TRINITY_DN19427_c0_g1_i1.p1  ORF type:complete len:217 (+),score=37.53 TRINITY_DN19427_c0_g1_i1:54-704(+)
MSLLRGFVSLAALRRSHHTNPRLTVFNSSSRISSKADVATSLKRVTLRGGEVVWDSDDDWGDWATNAHQSHEEIVQSPASGDEGKSRAPLALQDIQPSTGSPSRRTAVEDGVAAKADSPLRDLWRLKARAIEIFLHLLREAGDWVILEHLEARFCAEVLHLAGALRSTLLPERAGETLAKALLQTAPVAVEWKVAHGFQCLRHGGVGAFAAIAAAD